MVPLALYHVRARLDFRAQTLRHTKFIIHGNEDLSCEPGARTSLRFWEGQRSWKGQRSWEGLQFWEGQRFWEIKRF